MSLINLIAIGYSLYVWGLVLIVTVTKNPKSRYYFQAPNTSVRIVSMMAAGILVNVMGLCVLYLLAFPITWAILGAALIAFLITHGKIRK